jgi:hypothetical protein
MIEKATLKDLGLTATESMQAQRLAKMPADDFERSMGALIEGPSLKEQTSDVPGGSW